MIKRILRKLNSWAYKNNLIKKLIRIYDPPFVEGFPLRFELQGEYKSQPLILPNLRAINPWQDRLYSLFLDELYAKERDYSYGFYCVNNAAISMPSGVVRVRDGIVPDLMGGDSWFLINPRYFSGFFRTYRSLKKIEEGCLLTLPFDNNYYHWLIETLPRLSIIEKLQGMSNDLNLLMPAVQDRPEFVWDSLNTVGWGSRIHNLEAGSYRVKNLYIPGLTAPRSHISQEALLWLRNKFLNSNSIYSFHDHDPCERIYIARDDAPVRNVINSVEMDDLMSELGFKKITMSGRSVAEQAKIFSKANFIVGIHGAALANVAFCKKGATLLEVFMDGLFTKAFFNLARDLDMNYGCFLARNDNGNLYIDTNQLRVLLLKIIH